MRMNLIEKLHTYAQNPLEWKDVYKTDGYVRLDTPLSRWFAAHTTKFVTPKYTYVIKLIPSNLGANDFHEFAQYISLFTVAQGGIDRKILSLCRYL